jgi:hypothetical protein
MQRANRSERDGFGATGPTASGDQEKGRFKERKRDLPFPELTYEPQIITAEPARSIGQAKIKVEQRLKWRKREVKGSQLRNTIVNLRN